MRYKGTEGKTFQFLSQLSSENKSIKISRLGELEWSGVSSRGNLMVNSFQAEPSILFSIGIRSQPEDWRLPPWRNAVNSPIDWHACCPAMTLFVLWWGGRRQQYYRLLCPESGLRNPAIKLSTPPSLTIQIQSAKRCAAKAFIVDGAARAATVWILVSHYFLYFYLKYLSLQPNTCVFVFIHKFFVRIVSLLWSLQGTGLVRNQDCPRSDILQNTFFGLGVR